MRIFEKVVRWEKRVLLKETTHELHLRNGRQEFEASLAKKVAFSSSEAQAGPDRSCDDYPFTGVRKNASMTIQGREPSRIRNAIWVFPNRHHIHGTFVTKPDGAYLIYEYRIPEQERDMTIFLMRVSLLFGLLSILVSIFGFIATQDARLSIFLIVGCMLPLLGSFTLSIISWLSLMFAKNERTELERLLVESAS